MNNHKNKYEEQLAEMRKEAEISNQLQLQMLNEKQFKPQSVPIVPPASGRQAATPGGLNQNVYS